MKILELFNNFKDYETIVRWLTDKGILHDINFFSCCGQIMNLQKFLKKKNCPIIYRCLRCKKIKSPLIDSIFENLKIDIRVLF